MAVPGTEEAGNTKDITTRRIDAGKGDANNHNYRARLAGREIKTDQRNRSTYGNPAEGNCLLMSLS